MSRYEGVDFYNIEQHLTEEETMVRDLVREWVDEKVIPIIEREALCSSLSFPISSIGCIKVS